MPLIVYQQCESYAAFQLITSLNYFMVVFQRQIPSVFLSSSFLDGKSYADVLSPQKTQPETCSGVGTRYARSHAPNCDVVLNDWLDADITLLDWLNVGRLTCYADFRKT